MSRFLFWGAASLLLLLTAGCGGDDLDPTACDGSGQGTVAAGESVVVSGGGLAGSGISLPLGAAREGPYHVEPFDVQIGCAQSQVPEGYAALGPAVTFAPGHARFLRDVPMTIPVLPDAAPEGTSRADIQVSYTGPGVDEPRIVPLASLRVVGDPGAEQLSFGSRRLGTFQAVVPATSPEPRMREYTFQGITGVSMGSGGAGLIGLHNPDEFDLVAPLGGPVDWIYMLDYIRTYHLGGFCTEEERQADQTGCEMGADVSRTPPSDQIHEHRQDFEHWHYVDEYGGQGGTFDRHEYVQIFRDLTFMYGNANTTRSTDPSVPNITPPGVPESWREMTPADQCDFPVRIPPCEDSTGSCAVGTGFFDDEYNPQGQHPVITFCDGAEVTVDGERDVGVWDSTPENNDFPTVVMAAVDINDNGVRDAGEPVIRAGREPFDDCGLDGLCNPDEPGFSADNPDPNGDDYDFQFNPNGTEGNWLRDTPDGDPCNPDGETYVDAGLDGVMGTAQLDAGGFDVGEGNGCWDLAQGADRMLELNPRSMALEMDESTLRDIDVFSDGGIRDLFNFGVVHDHFAGAFAARGGNLRLYNGHAALMPTAEAERFDPLEVDFGEIGKYVMVRYGDPDASEAERIAGDGGHVGTGGQLVSRLLAVLGWMSARWPGGNREMAFDMACPDCETQFTFDFTSTLGRTGPVGVVLPPGYHNPENADLTYPIVYFGHGYGQEPQDLVDIGVIIRDRMGNPAFPEEARLQKMILVFPDGLCRGDECLQGTFYADAYPGNASSPQMETWVLELTQHMRDNYRVKEPATFEITE